MSLKRLLSLTILVCLLTMGLTLLLGMKAVNSLVLETRKQDFCNLLANVSQEVDQRFAEAQRSTVDVGTIFASRWQARKSLPSGAAKAYMQTFHKKMLYQPIGGGTPKAIKQRDAVAGLYLDQRPNYSDDLVSRMQVLETMADSLAMAHATFQNSWDYIMLAENVTLVVPVFVEDFPPEVSTLNFYTAADFAHRRPGWVEPYNDLGGEGVMVTSSNPIYAGKTLLGVVGHDIYLDQVLRDPLTDLSGMRDIRSFVITASGKAVTSTHAEDMAELMAVDRRSYLGTLYYRDPSRLVELPAGATVSRDALLNRVGERAVAEAVANAGRTVSRQFQIEDGERSWEVFASPVPTNHWIIISLIPSEWLYGDVASRVRQVAISTVVALLVVLAIALVMGHWFVGRPVAALASLVYRFGGGDYTARATGRSAVSEIRELETSFDTMAGQIMAAQALVVEDNDVNQQVAKELLESAGASVRIANHGREALEILTAGEQPPPFDVVLMNLQMPEMDGFTATRLLRAKPELRGLPIIAMTADVMAEAVQRRVEAGMNDHVAKPIDPDALFATLVRWTKSRLANAADPVAMPVRTDDEVILPEIEGIDMVGGLQRVAGNKRLYRDLLSQFVSRQGSAGAQIASAIESGDRSLAERLAHSVKGVAGNIGMNAVFQMAGKMESAICESRADELAVLKQFTSELDRQVQVILKTLKVATPLPTRRDDGRMPDPAAASAAAARLRMLLEAGDADAAEAYSALAEILTGAVDTARLHGLGASVNAFDFDAALLKLDKVATEFGIDRK